MVDVGLGRIRASVQLEACAPTIDRETQGGHVCLAAAGTRGDKGA